MPGRGSAGFGCLPNFSKFGQSSVCRTSCPGSRSLARRSRCPSSRSIPPRLRAANAAQLQMPAPAEASRPECPSMTTVQKTCHVRSSTRRRTPVLDFLSLAEQHRAFQRRALVDLDPSRGVLQKPRPAGRRANPLRWPSSFAACRSPASGTAGGAIRERVPQVLALVTHSPRQVDPDPLAQLISGLGVEPVTTGREPDHRIVARDEIEPGLVLAPVAEAVQKRRIGRACIVTDHRGSSNRKR